MTAKRAAEALFTLLLSTFLVYILMGLMPGDPVDMMMSGNPRATPEDIARLRTFYGLDQPLYSRYGHWLLSLLQGDAGYSRIYSLPVFDILWPRLLNTALLMGIALLLTLAAAVPLGVYAARKKDSASDRAASFFSLAALSAPPFWIALLLIALFAVRLHWLPANADPAHPLSLILPVLTLTLGGLAVYMRHTRGAMIAALKENHIRTAYAKGCDEKRVVWKHAFVNALPPLVTLFMLDLGSLIGGAVTVETIFAYPGMGRLLFDAVMGNDFNLALIGFLLLALCTIAANLAGDALLARLDPRGEKAA